MKTHFWLLLLTLDLPTRVVSDDEVPSNAPSTDASEVPISDWPSTAPQGEGSSEMPYSEAPSSIDGSSYTPYSVQPSMRPSLEPTGTYTPDNSEAPTATPYEMTYAPSEGGEWSCYDYWANGLPENDDCFAVDFTICTEEYAGGCVLTSAYYEYYNIIYDKDGEVEDWVQFGCASITSAWNCANQPNSCTVEDNTGGTCNCEIEGNQIVLDGCTGSFAPFSIFTMAEGGGYPNLDLDCDVSQVNNVDGNPTLGGLRSRSAFGDKKTKDNTGLYPLTIRPHLTLVFFEGHQDEDPPSSGQILSLLERTQQYLRDMVLARYPSSLQSLHVAHVYESYQIQPRHQFEIVLEAKFTSNTVLPIRALTDLMSNPTHLEGYVRDYARFADSARVTPNGLFYQTHVVEAKIVGLVPPPQAQAGEKESN